MAFLIAGGLFAWAACYSADGSWKAICSVLCFGFAAVLATLLEAFHLARLIRQGKD